MSMPQANVYQTYRKSQIQTASPGELLLLLYDRAVLQTRQAAKLIREGKPGEAHNCLIKAQDIVTELMVTLNLEAGEIARNLQALYDYLRQRLIQANIHKDAAIAAEVGGILAELRDAWVQIVRGGGHK
ncbi:MAG: flagellar export chaperone FliS [bacterium]|jgi:flagellar protein FliS